MREKIKGITATASPATIKAREVARRALLKGEAWAVKRYGGGKMGTRIPAQSDRLFHDSGRFIESIVAAAAKDGTFRVNVAANRLSPDTLNGGQGALEKIWARLVQLVPEFQDVGLAMQSDDVLRARVNAARGMITKLRKSSEADGLLRAAKAVANIGRSLYGIGESLAAG